MGTTEGEAMTAKAACFRRKDVHVHVEQVSFLSCSIERDWVHYANAPRLDLTQIRDHERETMARS